MLLIDREKENYISRLEMALSNVRHQNSGADIHLIGNIRNAASLLIGAIEDDIVTKEEATHILTNIETSVANFFVKKYGKV